MGQWAEVELVSNKRRPNVPEIWQSGGLEAGAPKKTLKRVFYVVLASAGLEAV